MARTAPVGHRVRALRRRAGLKQAQLAAQLGISPSYLNLIEHDRRSLSAPLLIQLSRLLDLDLSAFAGDAEERMATDLLEAFGDPLFEGHDVTAAEVREVAAASPAAARAVLALYQAWRGARESAETLAARVEGGDGLSRVERARLPSEEVNDLIQGRMNHFPELEEGAEEVWRKARLGDDDLYLGLVRHLADAYGVTVRVEKVAAMRGAVRRYDHDRKLLLLSEALRNARATRLVTDASGAASSRSSTSTPTATRASVAADRFVLAASAIESARLCLLSDPGGPGLGNSSGLLGRHLMFHYQTIGVGMYQQSLHGERGRSVTTGISDFRGVPNDAEPCPLGGIVEFGTNSEKISDARTYLIDLGFRGSELKQYLRASPFGAHIAVLIMQAEDAPQPTNRVDLDPDVRDIDGLRGAAHHLSAARLRAHRERVLRTEADRSPRRRRRAVRLRLTAIRGRPHPEHATRDGARSAWAPIRRAR